MKKLVIALTISLATTGICKNEGVEDLDLPSGEVIVGEPVAVGSLYDTANSDSRKTVFALYIYALAYKECVEQDYNRDLAKLAAIVAVAEQGWRLRKDHRYYNLTWVKNGPYQKIKNRGRLYKFRTFSSPQEAVKAFLKFIHKYKRYRKVVKADKLDIMVKELAKGGYCEDREDYYVLLQSIRNSLIKRNVL